MCSFSVGENIKIQNLPSKASINLAKAQISHSNENLDGKFRVISSTMCISLKFSATTTSMALSPPLSSQLFPTEDLFRKFSARIKGGKNNKPPKKERTTRHRQERRRF